MPTGPKSERRPADVVMNWEDFIARMDINMLPNMARAALKKTRLLKPSYSARVAVTFIFFAVAGPLSASAENQIGAGGQSCGVWVANRSSNELDAMARDAMNSQWVLGFLSAIALFDEKVSAALSRTDSEGIKRWVDNYCKSFPLSRISNAAEGLAGEIRSNSK